MPQMRVTWSHIKDALKKCPINGTESQEKYGPLEYAIKFRGPLRHNFTALDLEQTGGLVERCGQRMALISLILKPTLELPLTFLFCTHHIIKLVTHKLVQSKTICLAKTMCLGQMSKMQNRWHLLQIYKWTFILSYGIYCNMTLILKESLEAVGSKPAVF